MLDSEQWYQFPKYYECNGEKAEINPTEEYIEMNNEVDDKVMSMLINHIHAIIQRTHFDNEKHIEIQKGLLKLIENTNQTIKTRLNQ